MHFSIGSLLLTSLCTLSPALCAQDFGRDWWVLDSQGRGGRSPVHTDAVEALLVRGQWKRPEKGSTLLLADGKKLEWESTTSKKGRVAARRGGYAWTQVESDRDQTMLLAGKGHSLVYINGVPRVGNPYRTAWYRIPVRLRKGSNECLFRTGRGAIQPKLLPLEKPLFFSGLDHTLPDLILGERIETGLGVVLIHGGSRMLREAWIEWDCPELGEEARAKTAKTQLPTLLPCSVYKSWIPLEGSAPKVFGDYKVRLTLWTRDTQGTAQAVDTTEIKLSVKSSNKPHKRVYRSAVDGSAQYYVVNPPFDDGKISRTDRRHAGKQALILSLHGAGVEATNQAAAYAPKTDAYLAAPTNRRPYGFDWEDWGRQDAMDVLDQIERLYPIDNSRVYLTGHSMGGHGTWQIGATYPDRFAAIGPSAGWISFWSYSSARRYPDADPIEKMLLRAASPSDTLGLKYNYRQLGIYILHGDADKNVPIREARQMMKELSAFHQDYRIHEEKGAGHWWNRKGTPGADCVDWAAMFDFFARRRIPRAREVLEIDFTTMNPAISSSCSYASILEQQHKLEKSRLRMHFDSTSSTLVGTTENISILRLDAELFPKQMESLPLVMDGQPMGTLKDSWGPQATWLSRDSQGKWHWGGEALDFRKEVEDMWKDEKKAPGDGRQLAPRIWDDYGDGLDADFHIEQGVFQASFQQAFDRDFVLVVGTQGNDAENRWARNKARYDAETFWYRGNGSVEVIEDSDYKSESFPGRNVILYGHRESNAAWKVLLGKSPVQVGRGRIRIGDPKAGGRVLQGTDLACLFVQPLPGSQGGLVAAVSGTGLAGMRLTQRLPWFVSGVHYPDLAIIGVDMLEKGSKGVRAAGFFGRWGGMKGSEIVWRD